MITLGLIGSYFAFPDSYFQAWIGSWFPLTGRKVELMLHAVEVLAVAVPLWLIAWRLWRDADRAVREREVQREHGRDYIDAI